MDFSYSEIKNFTAKSLKTVSWAVTCRIQVKEFILNAESVGV